MSDEDGPLNDDASASARLRAEAKRNESRRGDATMGRIADLAGGWNVGGDAADPEEPHEAKRGEGKAGKSPAAVQSGLYDEPPALPPRASVPPPARPASRTAPPPPPRPAGRPGLPAPTGSPPRTASASAPPVSSSVAAPAAAAGALPPAAPVRRPGASAPPPFAEGRAESVDDELDARLDALGALDDATPARPAAIGGRPSPVEPKPIAPSSPPLAARPTPAPARLPTDDPDSIMVTFGGDSSDKTMDEDFDDFAKPGSSTSDADRSADSGLLFLPRPAAAPAAAVPAAPVTAPASPSASSASSAPSASTASTASSPAPSPAPATASKPADSTAADSPSSKAAAAASAPAAASSVPVGEFDSGGRGDPTMIDSSHLRGDQTQLREASAAIVADTGIAATLRHTPSLPRRRGVWGDLRYVFTVWAGTRRARRELRKLDREQAERERDRRRHLMTLGRAAATSAELDQTQIRKTRGTLQVVDQDRSNQAAQVAASDAEMEQVRKARAAKADAHRQEVEQLELEQKQLGETLEPMQRESAAARRRATDLRATLQKLDARTLTVEAGRGKWADSASQAAELAALRAERQSVTKDEPVIAAQLDALVPRIAAIEASRERLRRKVLELKEEEEEDAKRSDELLSAIAAKRKVVERATGDAEKARERMLAELGERLYVDRPSYLSAHLSPIDSLDLELGDGQRRMMELKEILSSIDRWKQARGLVMWLVILGAIGAGVWFWTQGQIPFLPPP